MDGKIKKSDTCLRMEKSGSQAGAYGWQYPKDISVFRKAIIINRSST